MEKEEKIQIKTTTITTAKITTNKKQKFVTVKYLSKVTADYAE